jgi:hypothetical protein
MSRTTALLQLIARMNPAMWDAIIPMGPILVGELTGRELLARSGAEAAADELNPQPLPPRSQILRASAGMSARLAELAVMSEAQNGNGTEVLLREIEDWCGNSPRPIPWPPNWPWPWPPPPGPDPDPNPWLTAEVFAVAALTLASIGARLDTRDAKGLREAFDKGAEQLADAAVAAGERLG